MVDTSMIMPISAGDSPNSLAAITGNATKAIPTM